MARPNDVATWIIEQRRLLPTLGVSGFRIVPASRKERFVLLDHTPFIVVDLPAAHHNTRRDVLADRVTTGERLIRRHSCIAKEEITKREVFSLRARLQQAAKAVRVRTAFDGLVTFGEHD